MVDECPMTEDCPGYDRDRRMCLLRPGDCEFLPADGEAVLIAHSTESATPVHVEVANPRATFAAVTEALIVDFHANGGQITSGPFAGRPVLLLTTTGAKSGQPRLAPLVYSRDGDAYVIVASKGGAPAHPAWYQNLLAHPVVTVEVGGETFEARARVTERTERDRLFAQRAATNPNFADYQQRTTRVIPVVLLERLRSGR